MTRILLLRLSRDHFLDSSPNSSMRTGKVCSKSGKGSPQIWVHPTQSREIPATALWHHTAACISGTFVKRSSRISFSRCHRKNQTFLASKPKFLEAFYRSTVCKRSTVCYIPVCTEVNTRNEIASTLEVFLTKYYLLSHGNPLILFIYNFL